MSGSPVILFVYNRIDTTARVFERIGQARPPVLLVVADGPHPGRPGDMARCEAVRALVTNPTWTCELRVNASPDNLGLGRRFASGLEWAFGEVEQAVILEDDCLPDPSFFPYCDELLERFRDDDDVMMVSGDNYQFGIRRGEASYFLSHGVGTYGWATWRRAFQHYDYRMQQWPVDRAEGWLGQMWPSPEAEAYWRDRFDETHRGEIDTWDYQWAYAMWRRGGLQVSPDRNLISYIGCLPDAVHTSDPSAPYCALPTVPMSWPMKHPPAKERNLGADLYEFYRLFLNRPHNAAIADEARVLAGRRGSARMDSP